MNWQEMTLSGWGRAGAARMQVCRPERESEIRAALGAADQASLIARGMGRSYGDAALNDGGRALLTRRLDRILSFDAGSGEVVAEPGVTFADLLAVFVPRGFMVPGTPGTGFATLGGALANDVHGKNHDRHGSFGDHVRWFELILSDGSRRRVSPESDPELFAATVGGVGLTGVVARICFALLPGASSRVMVQERRIADLEDFLAGFAEIRETATFSVGWIDALARGRSLGRGVLETAELARPLDGPRPRPRSRRLPIDLPGAVMSPLGIRLFNAYYYHRVPRAGWQRVKPLQEFLFPLDSLLDWNRLYGRRGFYQFQCVLPDGTAAVGLRALLEEIGRARGASFLAVLKTLGRQGRGHLSFPMRGHTLALDFPRRDGTEELLRKLEALTLDHGGRIYLAKDALLSAEGFQRMYPKLAQFRAVVERVDPQGRFDSDLARRLGIRGRTAP